LTGSGQRLALALLLATSAATPGLTTLALRLVLIEGTSRRWFGDSIRAAASYLLAVHADAEIASFLAGDRGSLLAAEILVTYCPAEMVAPLVPVLVAKLGRNVSPAVCRPIILRLLPDHADRIAEALAARPERLEKILNVLPHSVRTDVEVALAGHGISLPQRPPRDRPPPGMAAIRLEEVETASPQLLHIIANSHPDASIRAAARQRLPRRKAAPTREGPPTLRELIGLVMSPRREDQVQAAQRIPRERALAHLLGFLVDARPAAAHVALDKLVDVAPGEALSRVLVRPELASPPIVQRLAEVLPPTALSSLLSRMRAEPNHLTIDSALALVRRLPARVVAEHVSACGSISGQSVVAAVAVHQGDITLLRQLCNNVAGSIPTGDRHAFLRMVLVTSFRAWMVSGEVTSDLQSVRRALARIDAADWRGVFESLVAALENMLRAQPYTHFVPLESILGDAVALCARILKNCEVVLPPESGFLIERGEQQLQAMERWLKAVLPQNMPTRLNLRVDGTTAPVHLGTDGGDAAVLPLPSHLPPPKPDVVAALEVFSASLPPPSPDRLQNYPALRDRFTELASSAADDDLPWLVARLATHDAEYFDQQGAALRDWLHSLKNLARAAAIASASEKPFIAAQLRRYAAESGRLQGCFGVADLGRDSPETLLGAEVAESILAGEFTMANKRGVRVDIECAADLNVRTYKRRLERIAQNLVRNAIDAAPTSNGYVRIAVREASPELLDVRIDDNGVGLPADFDVARLAAGRTTKAKGNFGLGLVEARRLALEVGGDIALERRTDGGTSAHVRFPVL
jgi:hypothetical protein